MTWPNRKPATPPVEDDACAVACAIDLLRDVDAPITSEVRASLANDLFRQEVAIRNHLDALTMHTTAHLSLAGLARLVADEFSRLEKVRDDLVDKLEELEEAGPDVEGGYHEFATSLGWRYPDGEAMPSWHDLDDATQRAFRAFAKGTTR